MLQGDVMLKTILGLTILVTLATLMSGCASTVRQTIGYYHAPQKAYSLPLDINIFRGQVTLTEGCDHVGGSLNIWDAQNRFFRIDYLRINQNPLATVPAFAADRTIAEVVLSNYVRKVIPASAKVKSIRTMGKVFVKVRSGKEALFSEIALEMQPHSVGALRDTTQVFYYGFLIFKDGDLAYVLQHRMPVFQPDRMHAQLGQLADDLIIPGKPMAFSAPRAMTHVAHLITHGFANLKDRILGRDTRPLVETCEWNDVIAAPK